MSTASAVPLRAHAEIDLSAVRSSVAALDAVSGDAAVMAVVKADAYGHGMVPCAQAAVAAGAQWLGTAFVSEALDLRSAGLSVPILSMVSVPGEDLAAAISADIDLPVGTLASLRAAAGVAREAGRTARIHLKVDTGLSRGGATSGEWADLIDEAAKLEAEEAISVVGIWSHLACADEPQHPSTDAALDAFIAAVAEAEVRGVSPQLRHLASSGAVLSRPDTHFDLVRPGLATYGLSPFADGSVIDGMIPAMTLRTQVIQTKHVPAGTGISYGLRYETATDANLALVPVGYADGIPRAATNSAAVHLAGQQRTISGTVCMDQLVIDCGHDAVAAGDPVVVLGRSARGEPTAFDWAQACSTINYEIVTRIGARVPRIHINGMA